MAITKRAKVYLAPKSQDETTAPAIRFGFYAQPSEYRTSTVSL
jgi:hypothetical protein